VHVFVFADQFTIQSFSPNRSQFEDAEDDEYYEEEDAEGHEGEAQDPAPKQ
jgi:hypothetical protein